MEYRNFAIFKSICDLVNQHEFITAQEEFFVQHVDKFSYDKEENQLEHTTVHEGYIYILEKIIDIKLKEQYTQAEINAFYKSFKKNFSTFQSKNAQVVSTLNDFIDFQKFKETMIEWKKKIDFQRLLQPYTDIDPNEEDHSQEELKFHELVLQDPNDTQ